MKYTKAFADPDSALNKDAEAWSKEALNAMLDNVSRMGIVRSGKLFSALRYQMGYDAGGLVDRIGFKLLRYGIFVEYGVGRGNKIAAVRAGGAQLKRKPRPWFSQALEGNVRKLADIVAANRADAAVSAIDFGSRKIGAEK